jgi:hypothetical protein
MSTCVKCAALSCLRVAVDNFKLTLANRSRLLLPGSVRDIFKMLPEQFKSAGWRGVSNIQPLLPDQKCIDVWLKNNTWIAWNERRPSGIMNLIRAHPEIAYIPSSLISNGPEQTQAAPTEGVHLSTKVPSYPLLVFWTMSLLFKLGKMDVFRGTCRLISRDGRKCGNMTLDGYEETTFFNSQASFEIILISRATDYYAMLLEWNGGNCRETRDWKPQVS